MKMPSFWWPHLVGIYNVLLQPEFSSQAALSLAVHFDKTHNSPLHRD